MITRELIIFQQESLLTKKEVLESVEDYMKYLKTQSEDDVSERKRDVLLELLNRFYQVVQNTDVPTVKRPWFCYEYYINNYGITLELVKYEDMVFDDDMITESTLSVEYTLAEVKCEMLTVEDYAKTYGVSEITVRQWIRRGKLRTAKKVGRDWLIPSIADTPKRGFQPAQYSWEELPGNLLKTCGVSEASRSIYIDQDDYDKKIFHVIERNASGNVSAKRSMDTKEREKLELALISSSDVQIEELGNMMYLPPKRKKDILKYYKEREDFNMEDIIIRIANEEKVWFAPNGEVGNSFDSDDPDEYIIPVWMEVYGVETYTDELYERIENNDFSQCKKIGVIHGNIILFGEIVESGNDPVIFCDDITADLGAVAYYLTMDKAPLNDITGDPFQNLFYIEEIEMEKEFRDGELFDRIIFELPFVIKKNMHIKVDFLTYLVSEITKKGEADMLREKYESIGFLPCEGTNLLYAHVDNK